MRNRGGANLLLYTGSARVAQLVEQRLRNAQVAGSTPAVGLCGRLPCVTKTKVCNQCSARKPITDFYLRAKGGTRRYGHCKTCQNERAQASLAKNREKANARARRGRIKAKFGLTVEEHDALVAQPCAICGTTERQRIVDHCHRSGRVRGTLCSACNLILGHAHDDPDCLRTAIAYLVE